MSNQQFGILNGNSHTSQFIRECQQSPTENNLPVLPTPEVVNDVTRAYRGLISFHRRAERAYRSVGKTTEADAAKAKAEEMENKLASLDGSDNTSTGSRRDAGFGDSGPF